MESKEFPRSTNISKIQFDREAGRMLVTFMSGKTAEYLNVPADTHDTIVNAHSVGKEFNARIVKTKYPFKYV